MALQDEADAREVLTREEIDALITERILLFYRRLLMDGRLLDSECPHFGFPTARSAGDRPEVSAGKERDAHADGEVPSTHVDAAPTGQQGDRPVGATPALDYFAVKHPMEGGPDTTVPLSMAHMDVITVHDAEHYLAQLHAAMSVDEQIDQAREWVDSWPAKERQTFALLMLGPEAMALLAANENTRSLTLSQHRYRQLCDLAEKDGTLPTDVIGKLIQAAWDTENPDPFDGDAK